MQYSVVIFMAITHKKANTLTCSLAASIFAPIPDMLYSQISTILFQRQDVNRRFRNKRREYLQCKYRPWQPAQQYFNTRPDLDKPPVEKMVLPSLLSQKTGRPTNDRTLGGKFHARRVGCRNTYLHWNTHKVKDYDY